jgi:hypothetical protein
MSVSLWSRVGPQNTSAIREGLRMARKVFANEQISASGLTTSELYRLMLKEKPAEGFVVYDVKKNVLGFDRDAGQPGGKKLPPVPAHPEHPIRSMRYEYFAVLYMSYTNTSYSSNLSSFLKHQVLPIMKGNKEIRLATTTRIPTLAAEPTQQAQAKNKGKNKPATSTPVATPSPVTVRLWKPVTHPIPKTKEVNWGPYAKSFKPVGHEVGVGEDWGHLNRRRKRTRLSVVKGDHRFLVTTRRAEALEKLRLEREELEALKDRRWQRRKEKNKLRRKRVKAQRKALL